MNCECATRGDVRFVAIIIILYVWLLACMLEDAIVKRLK